MRKLPTILVVLLMLVIMAYSVSAVGFKLIKPAAGEYDVCGTYTFEANVSTGDASNVTFYISSGGVDTKLCSVSNTTVATIFLNSSGYTCTASTTGITDGSANITAKYYAVATWVAQNSSIVSEVDNSGPTLTFTTANTADGTTVDDASGLDVYVTSSEVLTSPAVVINGKSYAMDGSGLSWNKLFSAGDIPEGSYRYEVKPGSDNTTCTNAGTTAIRKIVIDETESAKAAAVANAVQQSQVTTTAAAQTTSNRQKLALAGAAVIVFVLYFLNKKHKR